jgi:hypothetical protein
MFARGFAEKHTTSRCKHFLLVSILEHAPRPFLHATASYLFRRLRESFRPTLFRLHCSLSSGVDEEFEQDASSSSSDTFLLDSFREVDFDKTCGKHPGQRRNLTSSFFGIPASVYANGTSTVQRSSDTKHRLLPQLFSPRPSTTSCFVRHRNPI